MEKWTKMKEGGYCTPVPKGEIRFTYGRIGAENSYYELALVNKGEEKECVVWNTGDVNNNAIGKISARELLKYESFLKREGLPAKRKHVLVDLLLPLLEEISA